MTNNVLRVMMGGVLLSALFGAAVFAGERQGAAAEAPKASTAHPAHARHARPATTPVAAQPATPAALKLYQHTTSSGKKCCAACNEIASDGSCKSWAQCSSGVTTCDAWTH